MTNALLSLDLSYEQLAQTTSLSMMILSLIHIYVTAIGSNFEIRMFV